MNVFTMLYWALRFKLTPKSRRRWSVTDALTGEEYKQLRAWMVNAADRYSGKHGCLLFTQEQAEYIVFYINMHNDFARFSGTKRII